MISKKYVKVEMDCPNVLDTEMISETTDSTMRLLKKN